MVSLTQNKQLALAIEDEQGVAETITAADLVTALNVKARVAPNLIDRPVNRGTFSKLAGVSGIQDYTATFEQEFAGPASALATDVAPIGKTLRGCGYREVPVYAVTMATFAGGIGSGDIIAVGTPAPTAFRGRVLETSLPTDFQNGDTTLFYELLTPGTNITPTDTSIVADNQNLSNPLNSVLSSAITPAITIPSQTGTRVGTAWVPTSKRKNSIAVTLDSGTFAIGDVIEQTVSTSPVVKAYGRVLEALTASGTLVFQQYSGSAAFKTTGGAVTTITKVGGGGELTSTADAVQSEGVSLTAKVFDDGISKTGSGCQGNAVITLDTSGFPRAVVTLQGGVHEVKDEANLTAGAGGAGAVQPFRGIRLDFDRVWSLCTSSVTIDLQNTLTRRTCATAPSGAEGYVITDRRPIMRLDPEIVQEQVFANYGNMLSATTFRSKLEWGTGTMNRWRVLSDSLQYEDLDDGDREGIITGEGVVRINDLETRLDQELTIINY